jgi:hypothetical protein
MSLNLVVTIDHCYPETKFENGEVVATGDWTLGIRGGAEDCPWEQSAYVRVGPKVGARVKTLMKDAKGDEYALQAKLVIEGDFDNLDGMVMCPNCGDELVLNEDDECRSCWWKEGEEIDGV